MRWAKARLAGKGNGAVELMRKSGGEEPNVTRPAPSSCFKDERAEKVAQACAAGSSVMEEGLAKLHALTNSAGSPSELWTKWTGKGRCRWRSPTPVPALRDLREPRCPLGAAEATPSRIGRCGRGEEGGVSASSRAWRGRRLGFFLDRCEQQSRATP